VKKFLLGTAAAVFLATPPATAADMPVKAPPVVAVAVYSWAGFYLGGNAGGGWGRSNLTLSPTNGIFAGSGFPLTQVGILATQVRSAKPNGFTGGVQIGYNVQSSNVLFGWEADANYFGLRKSFGHGPIPNGGLNSNSESGSISTDYLITLRPRIGLVHDRILVYGTGGLAVTTVEFSRTINVIGSAVGDGSFVGSDSKLRFGWTVGGGFELGLSGNWSAKFEYLYADFGKSSTVSTLTGFTTPFPAANGSAFTTDWTLKTHIARVGLNYKFGGPVVARY
jgi:outer membrane immunogenic protein